MTDSNPSPAVPRQGRRIQYTTIRDRFLEEVPETSEQDLYYFAEIGLFVFDRWQQIADDHAEGEDIDELASDRRWDECTESDLARYKRDAEIMIETAVRRLRAASFVREFLSKTSGLLVVSKVFRWLLQEAVSAFIGAIGIILFGLLFLKMFPAVNQAFRDTLEDIAPRDLPAEPAPAKNAI